MHPSVHLDQRSLVAHGLQPVAIGSNQSLSALDRVRLEVRWKGKAPKPRQLAAYKLKKVTSFDGSKDVVGMHKHHLGTRLPEAEAVQVASFERTTCTAIHECTAKWQMLC